MTKITKNKFLDDGPHPYRPLHKIKVVWNGFKSMFRHDFSFTYKVYISLIILGLSLWQRQFVDVLLVLLATGLVLSLELMNSALEAICDLIQPEYDERIKLIKDVAAAAAGLSILVWVIIIGWETWGIIRFWL
jgi:diacylglycerol kinase